MTTHLVLIDDNIVQAVIKKYASHKEFTAVLIRAIEDATGDEVELLPEINPHTIVVDAQEFTAKMHDYNYVFTLQPAHLY